MDNYFASLDALLNELVFQANDTIRLRALTGTLQTQYFTNPLAVPALVEIIGRSPHWQVRQLAAIELRKLMKFWSDQTPELKQQLRGRLLEIVVAETSVASRQATARAISAIAKTEDLKTEWPALIPFLYQCIESPNAAHREVGVFILQTLFENIVDDMEDQVATVIRIFTTTIRDPESLEVRTSTLKALAKVADFVEVDSKADVVSFQQIIPAMMEVIAQNIQCGNYDQAVTGIQAFDEMLTLEAPLLNRHISQLIEFMLNLATNSQVEESVRLMSLSFIRWTCVYKGNKLLKLKLVAPIIKNLMPVAAEDEPEDNDEDSPARLALGVLHTLGTNQPAQQVFPILIQIVLQYMTNTDPKYRKAAMLGFAMSIEGCADFVRPKIQDLVQLICAGLQDPEDLVRKAACMALGTLADHIPEAVTENHATLLPLIVNLMNNPNESTARNACNALDALLENLGADIVPYLPNLMEKLIWLMDNGSSELKINACAAIGSAAQSAEIAFRPFFAEVMRRMEVFVQLQSEGYMLRGVAIDTVGLIAEAVGKEMFRPYMEGMMKVALEGLKLDAPKLREVSFVFFALASKVFEEEMAGSLPLIVPELLETCKQEEKLFDVGEKEGEEDEDLDVDSDGEDQMGKFEASTAIADEKEIAADVLGDLFENTRGHFLPYVPAATETLAQLVDHYSEGVRKAAIGSMFTFAKTLYVMSEPQKWEPGFPPKVPVHENVSAMLQQVVPLIMKAWSEEDDRSTASNIIINFNDALKLMGPVVIAGRENEILENIKAILDHQSYCQQASDNDEEEEGSAVVEDEEQQAEQEAALISSACDLIGALALVFGAQFVPSFRVFYPYIEKYYTPKHSVSDRSMSVGTFSEVISGMQQVSEFTEPLFKLFLQAMKDPEEEVRSNACYGMGVLVQYSDVDMSAQYGTILQALGPLFRYQQLPNMTDNACGCLARMIMKNTDAVPLKDVFPTFLQALPLRQDYQENEPVYQCLMGLIKAGRPELTEHMAQLRDVFIAVLDAAEKDSDILKEDTRRELALLVQQ